MDIEDLRRIYPEFSRFIQRKRDILRWGIGYKEVAGVPSETLAFIVTVSRGTPDDHIPEQFQGVPVEIVEGDPMEPCVNDGPFNQLPGGVGLSTTATPGIGTLGCYVRCEAYNNLFLLSNNHVIAAANAGKAGDVLTHDANQIATLFRHPLLWPGENVDCAVGRMLRAGPDPATSPDALIGILDAFGEHIDVSADIGTIGASTAECAMAAGILDTSSGETDLVLVYVDAPAGPNKAYVSVGRDFAGGNVNGGWTQPKPINQWIGDETQALGAAIADVNGDGNADLILFWIDNRSGPNNAFYRVGWNIDRDGNVAQWSPPIQIPGWWGSETAGGGIAVGQLSFPGQNDLVVFFIDNPSGANMGYLRVGTALDPTGHATWDAAPQSLGGQWGNETQGADITFLGPDPNNLGVSFLLTQVDNPAGENVIRHRTVNLSEAGRVLSVGPVRNVGGWVGAESAGLGSVMVSGPQRMLAVATIDNPSGGNRVTLRVANAMPGPQFGRWWSRPRTDTRKPQLGTYAWKSGRTTELWGGGKITQVSVSAQITYPAPAGTTLLSGLFEIKPRIQDKGDSGSIVFDDKGFPIGLVVGSTMREGTACEIDNVLQSLQTSSPYLVPGVISDQTRGVGVAAVNWMGAAPRIDLVVANADASGKVFYRVGNGIDVNGQILPNAWSNPFQITNTPSVRDTREIGLAVAGFAGDPAPALVLLEVGSDGPGQPSATMRVGPGFNVSGQVTQAWTGGIPIPWIGADCQGADVAVGNISSGNDVALLTVFRDGNQNTAMVRIGLNFRNGRSTNFQDWANWKDWVQIPGWFGTRTQGAGIAIVDIDGSGNGDLVIFFVDDSSGSNVGYFRVGKANAKGNYDWDAPQAIPKWWGDQTRGAGLAVVDLTGNGRPDLIAAHADNPPGIDRLFYRIVYDLMPTGFPARWSIAS